MAALLQLLLNVFAYFANYAISKLGVRYGIRLALVTFWIAATATVTASVNGILSGLSSVMPAMVQTAISLLPPSTGACIAALAACRAACWLYVSGVYVASAKARI
ncbi:TPA: DUF5455 family protein [Stenotrophomonas maltophilia]|nr:DUF5455 family protein [Stenotrophomonas maltophilia]